MKKFSLVLSWVLSLGLLAGCNALHTQSNMQKTCLSYASFTAY